MNAVVVLPWTTPPITGNRTRGNPHARAGEVKAAKDAARYAIRAARLRPVAGANIALVLRVADRRRRDADNLFPTLKAVQDSLVAEGVLRDDSWVSVPAATCRIDPPVRDLPAAMWLELTPPDPEGWMYL